MPRRRPRAAEAAAAVAAARGGHGLRQPAPGERLRAPAAGARPRRTARPIRVGIITSATSPVGGDAFTGPRDGAQAYFDRLNARGGIDGRQVEVRACDDGGSGVGNNDLRAQADRRGQGGRAGRHHRPRLRGRLPRLPRARARHRRPAHRRRLRHLSAPVRHLRQPRPAERDAPAGAASCTAAPRSTATSSGSRAPGPPPSSPTTRPRPPPTPGSSSRGLKAEGYKVVTEQVDFALPNFRAAAADLKEQGADLVFDAIDTHGNARLCAAMDDGRREGHGQGHQRAELDLHRPATTTRTPRAAATPCGRPDPAATTRTPAMRRYGSSGTRRRA